MVTTEKMPVEGIKACHYKKINKTQRQQEWQKATRQPENNTTSIVSLCVSLITSKVNGLNSPIKRNRVDGWILKIQLYKIRCKASQQNISKLNSMTH